VDLGKKFIQSLGIHCYIDIADMDVTLWRFNGDGIQGEAFAASLYIVFYPFITQLVMR
jgi:hypothetical protein